MKNPIGDFLFTTFVKNPLVTFPVLIVVPFPCNVNGPVRSLVANCRGTKGR